MMLLRSSVRGFVVLFGPASLLGCSVSHRMGPIPPCGPVMKSAEITWYGPSDPSDRRANERRCATTGPSVVIPAPSGVFEPIDPLDSLAIFSWNVAVGAGDLRSFLEEEVGLVCSGPDTRPSVTFPHFVVLLQEAFRRSTALPYLDDSGLAARKARHDPHPGGDLDTVELARLCGLAVLYIPSGRNGTDSPGEISTDKGNAILSSLPLSDFLAVENPFETERKVAVAASVEVPGGEPLRLVSAHLEVSTTFRRALLTGNQTRLRQAGGLIDGLDEHDLREGRHPPTLIGGDFNTWSGGEAVLKRLRMAYPDSPEWDGNSTRGPFPTDHVFFRRGSGDAPTDGGSVVLLRETYRRTDSLYSSDHQARFVRLKIGGGPAQG